MKTAIITVSTSVAAGRAEDRSGRGAGQAGRGRRSRNRRPRGRRRRPQGDREGPAAPRGRWDRADLHDRRHRLHPRRRNARGDQAVIEREAPGSPRRCGRSRSGTPRWGSSRAGVGHRGPHPDRQLPRQPERDWRGVSGDRRRCSGMSRPPSTVRPDQPPVIELRGLSRHFGERTVSGRLACRSRRGRRSPSSGATARASRRCCGCSRRSCGSTAVASPCSARSCRAGRSPSAGGLGLSATTRSSTAT